MENLPTPINYLAKGISVIVPVFNSESSVKELNNRIISVINNEDLDYEIIFINDASSDNSSTVLHSLAASDLNIKYIDFNKNYGQHNAILYGIRVAKFSTIVTLDDDLQNPPEEIPKLLQKLNEGFDVVYAYPKQEKHGFLRNLASFLTKMALKRSMGIENAEHVSPFRAFNTSLREAFDQYKGSFVSIDVLLSWGTNSFAAIPVDYDKRRHGKSNYTFRKLVQHGLNMITGFSIIPLQIASIMGFIFAFFGFGVLLFVLGRFFLEGSPVPGFPFLASIIAIFSGAQLLAIGIIGEYLARQHFRMLNKPQYFVKDKLQNK